jgi:hypothetical protein
MDKKPFPIVNSEQADLLLALAKEQLGPDLACMISTSPINMNHLIRFMGVASMCRARREEKGLGFKDISSGLKIPQYKLKAIEESSTMNIVPEILDKYVEYLGLGEEFGKWMEENREVYEGLGGEGVSRQQEGVKRTV